MKRYSIGVDLGGTKILAGIVEKETGKVLYEVKKKRGMKKSGGKSLKPLMNCLKFQTFLQLKFPQ